MYTVSVHREFPFGKWRFQLTTVPFKPLTHQWWQNYSYILQTFLNTTWSLQFSGNLNPILEINTQITPSSMIKKVWLVPCESFNGGSLEITSAELLQGIKETSIYDTYHVKIRTCLINVRFFQILPLNPIKLSKRFYE